LTLSACGKTTDLSAVKSDVKKATAFCSVAKPIEWDDEDTDDTIVQVKQHNSVWKALKCDATKGSK